ncbi:MAG TPA: hypothetical protein VFC29_20585 [Candidatus Limnocylindrales bacterium]|nr:hypothetical protein [Candidatus Limnocylindrales bacterium]
MQALPDDDEEKVWDLVGSWAKTVGDDSRKAILQERIRQFAFTRRSKSLGVKNETKDRARAAYVLLAPQDVVIRHRWLFLTQWVQESPDELEEDDFDYEKRDQKIRDLRVHALQEIWEEKGFEGLKSLLRESACESTIGWHMADGVIAPSSTAGFLKNCLDADDENLRSKMDELIRGVLLKMQADVLLQTHMLFWQPCRPHGFYGCSYAHPSGRRRGSTLIPNNQKYASNTGAMSIRAG